ncbi:MAG TPA: Tex-like N-terminal domain-containing protein [Planctomycetota bacterium]|nr:Tex-like N-terminal domain-containing protein [Planctomycetota bacterium]
MAEPAVVDRIVSEFPANAEGVRACVALLEEGAAIPFLARYRRERTGGLDEATIRRIELRLRALGELERRRASILRTLRAEPAPEPALLEAIEKAPDRTALEDLFAPHRPAGKGRGSAARAKGLDALARLLRDPGSAAQPLEALAAPFVDPAKGIATAEEAAEGALHVLVEAFADLPAIRRRVREEMRERGMLVAVGFDEKKEGAAKYRDYAQHREPLRAVAPHRFLALRRAERDRVLALAVEVDAPRLLGELAAHVVPSGASEGVAAHLVRALREAFEEHLVPRCAADVRLELKERADEEAIDVFARNLRHLLLSAPFGPRPILGVEAATKGAWRVAVVDAAGRCAADAALRVGEPAQRGEALGTVRALLETHGIEGIAVGSGPGRADVLAFAREAVRGSGRRISLAVVNDAGVAVQAASPAAREELPNLDQNLRAAVVLARRMQDPLAEIVKLEPRAIGVGEYQQDVNRLRLDHALEATLQSCASFVGVDPNAAGAALLARVAGISPPLAEAIVKHRTEAGPFRQKADLLAVPGFDARAFEQAAGFLRLREGAHPLDGTGVHPEHVDLVERMAARAGKSLAELVGNRALLDALPVEEFALEGKSAASVRDVVHDLALAGRDPRARFRAIAFRDDVHSIEDLREGMTLEGIVTNVTNFGAFVDLGLAQDGLVHVSEMAGRFVRDPQEVVRVGEVVRARVVAVDRARGRIGLSLKPPPPPPPPPASSAGKPPEEKPVGTVGAASREVRAEAGARADGRGAPEVHRRAERPPPPVVRAASHRRDGLVKAEGKGRGDRRGRGSGGEGAGRRGGPPRFGRGRPREGSEPEGADESGAPRPPSRPSRAFVNNPFRTFFEQSSPPEPAIPSAPAPLAAEPPVPASALSRPVGDRDAVLGPVEVDPSEASPRAD